MQTEEVDIQKAILASLKYPGNPFDASGTTRETVRGFRRTRSDTVFARIDTLRRDGISPAASRCTHLPVSNIRSRKQKSLTEQIVTSNSLKSLDRQGSSEEESNLEDSILARIIRKEIVLPSNNGISFDDIAGLNSVKRLLAETVTLPLLMPDYFQGIREPWKGILLFGPPGTGKTLLAKALARTQSVTFFNCTSSTLTSKYRGESEKLVRKLFVMARTLAPSVIFFDEADALVSKRGTSDEHEASRRFKAELLQQMDGVLTEEGLAGKHVMVLATSNCPWDIDEAVLRRFERRIYIPLPKKSYRKAAIELHLKGVKHEVDVDELADLLEGYSGADIRLVCKDASMMHMRTVIHNKTTTEILNLKDAASLDAVVTMEDFKKAIEKSSSSVKTAERYQQWDAQFGSK